MLILLLDDLFIAVCSILELFLERTINTKGNSLNISVLWKGSVWTFSHIQCDLLPLIHME